MNMNHDGCASVGGNKLGVNESACFQNALQNQGTQQVEATISNYVSFAYEQQFYPSCMILFLLQQSAFVCGQSI